MGWTWKKMKPPPRNSDQEKSHQNIISRFEASVHLFSPFLCLPEFFNGFALPCDGECAMLQNYVNWIGTLPSNSGKWRLGSLKMCKSWWHCDEAGRDPILLIKCTRQSSNHSALENQSIWTYWLINHKQTRKKKNIKATFRNSLRFDILLYLKCPCSPNGLLKCSKKLAIPPFSMPRNQAVKALGFTIHSHGPTIFTKSDDV